MENNSMFDKLGGRKFILTLIVIAVGTAIELMTSRGVSTGFVSLLVGVLTVFSAGNVAITRKAMDQAASGPDTEAAPAPAPAVVDTSKLEASIAEVKETQGKIAEVLQVIRNLMAAALKS